MTGNIIYMDNVVNFGYEVFTSITKDEIKSVILTSRDEIIAIHPMIRDADKLKYEKPSKAFDIYWECAQKFKKYIYPYHQACICCRKLKDYDRELCISIIIDS